LVCSALKGTTPKKISHLLSKLAPPHTTAVKAACIQPQKMKTINKASHPLSKLAPPHPMAVKAFWYSSIPIKGIPLLTFRNDPDEPMIE
jgi:hypothetical protein